MCTEFVLYGIGGVKEQYRALRYEVIHIDDIKNDFVRSIQYEVAAMKAKRPDIERVFMIDNFYGVGKEYFKSQKLGTIEAYAIFKDMLERQGIELT